MAVIAHSPAPQVQYTLSKHEDNFCKCWLCITTDCVQACSTGTSTVPQVGNLCLYCQCCSFRLQLKTSPISLTLSAPQTL